MTSLSASRKNETDDNAGSVKTQATRMASRPVGLFDLPMELLHRIADFVPLGDLLSLKRACRATSYRIDVPVLLGRGTWVGPEGSHGVVRCQRLEAGETFDLSMKDGRFSSRSAYGKIEFDRDHRERKLVSLGYVDVETDRCCVDGPVFRRGVGYVFYTAHGRVYRAYRERAGVRFEVFSHGRYAYVWEAGGDHLMLTAPLRREDGRRVGEQVVAVVPFVYPRDPSFFGPEDAKRKGFDVAEFLVRADQPWLEPPDAAREQHRVDRLTLAVDARAGLPSSVSCHPPWSKRLDL